jgi:hypothetical protein
LETLLEVFWLAAIAAAAAFAAAISSPMAQGLGWRTGGIVGADMAGLVVGPVVVYG